MLGTAGLFLLAGQLLDAAALTALGESDDARAVPHLERALAEGVDELNLFPAAWPLPDLEDEIVAALIALERLDQENALVRARAILRAPVSERVALVARRVAARAGDHDVVHTALGEYFRDRVASRLVLGDAAAANKDIRPRDFLDFAELPIRRPTSSCSRACHTSSGRSWFHRASYHSPTCSKPTRSRENGACSRSRRTRDTGRCVFSLLGTTLRSWAFPWTPPPSTGSIPISRCRDAGPRACVVAIVASHRWCGTTRPCRRDARRVV